MHNARRPSLVNRRGQLRPEEERELTREFQLMDQNGDDRLDWWEFVNHESKRYLARKDKVQFFVRFFCLFVLFLAFSK